MMLLLSVLALVALWTTSLGSALPASRKAKCDTIQHGYQCRSQTSHYWGQYSPYFSVPSTIPTDLPPGCKVNMVQILSRHGARDPTASKTASYNKTIRKFKTQVKQFLGDYAFLSDYEYTLGADQLTLFGQQEMFNSGIKFYNRYRSLAKGLDPFVRASSEARVLESAQNFTQGYHQIKSGDPGAVDKGRFPLDILVISEAEGSNNTLNHGLCTAFEDEAPFDETASDAQSQWLKIFTPPITTRLNANLAGANLSSSETISLMDLCPFNTVASATGQISPFCNLFTQEEWQQYDYYESLGKYYGYSSGNALGPTQGVGFTNELIARLTHSPVRDHTSSNQTLDSRSATFPISKKPRLYADFSHDNDMTAIFSAMGLYNTTGPLSNTTVETTAQTHGFSASWTVPFAARAYFEKLDCGSPAHDYVRVLVNDRVLPLETCGGDGLGRCTVTKFIESLTFARNGGHWDQCQIK